MKSVQQTLPFKRTIRLGSGEHVVRTLVANVLPWHCRVCASGFRTKQALQGHYSSKLHLQQKALQEKFRGPGIFREQRGVPVIVDAEQEAILPARAGLFCLA